MRRQQPQKSMFDHCVKIFNSNKDIDTIDYSNHNERITIKRVEKEPKRTPLGFAVGDVIEQEDDDYGEYCLKRSKRK